MHFQIYKPHARKICDYPFSWLPNFRCSSLFQLVLTNYNLSPKCVNWSRVHGMSVKESGVKKPHTLLRHLDSNSSLLLQFILVLIYPRFCDGSLIHRTNFNCLFLFDEFGNYPQRKNIKFDGKRKFG